MPSQKIFGLDYFYAGELIWLANIIGRLGLSKIEK